MAIEQQIEALFGCNRRAPAPAARRRHSSLGARDGFGAGEVRNEVRQVMPRSFASHGRSHRRRSRGIADEVVAAAVVLQIVIASEPGNMHEIAGRTKLCRTFIQVRTRVGRIRRSRAGRQPSSSDRTAAKPGLGDDDPGFTQLTGALAMGRISTRCAFPSSLQRGAEAHEEDFGAALRCACHRLQQPRVMGSAPRSVQRHRSS